MMADQSALPGSVAVTVVGEALWLLPSRALYWPARRTLLMADMHCGKAATFRAGQLAIPDGNMEADFERLTVTLESTDARRLVILGDWIHAAVGCTERVIHAMRLWRDRHRGRDVVWIRGNHDRGRRAHLAAQLGFCECEELQEGPFRFCHDPAIPGSRVGQVAIGGHEHPTVRLWSPGMPRLTAPCFHLTPSRIVLPAFGSFTGGHRISIEAHSRVFAVTEEQVVDLTPLVRPARANGAVTRVRYPRSARRERGRGGSL